MRRLLLLPLVALLAAAALAPACQPSSAASPAGGVSVPVPLLPGAETDDTLTQDVTAGVHEAVAGNVKARWLYRRCVEDLRVITLPAPRGDAAAVRERLLTHLRHETGLDSERAGRVAEGRWSYAMHKGLTDSFALDRKHGAKLRLLVMPTWDRRDAAELDDFEAAAVKARPDHLLLFALEGDCRK